MSRVCRDPADTIRWINVGLTLVHRQRRWTNVNPPLNQRLVSAGNVSRIVALPAPITGLYNKGIQYLSPEGLRGKNSISWQSDLTCGGVIPSHGLLSNNHRESPLSQQEMLARCGCDDGTACGRWPNARSTSRVWWASDFTFKSLFDPQSFCWFCCDGVSREKLVSSDKKLIEAGEAVRWNKRLPKVHSKLIQHTWRCPDIDTTLMRDWSLDWIHSSLNPFTTIHDGNFRRHSSSYVTIHDGNFRRIYYSYTRIHGSWHELWPRSEVVNAKSIWKCSYIPWVLGCKHNTTIHTCTRKQ